MLRGMHLAFGFLAFTGEGLVPSYAPHASLDVASCPTNEPTEESEDEFALLQTKQDVRKHVQQPDPLAQLVEEERAKLRRFADILSVKLEDERTGTAANQTARLDFTQAEQEEMLTVTNTYRCMHGADDAVWSATLASEMESYIRNLNGMIHDPTIYGSGTGRPCGENLFWSSRAGTPTQAADAWYSEVNDCATGSPESFTDGCQQPVSGRMTGHFTVMVWTSATEIGCAYSNDRLYIGCRYKVPGETSLSYDTPNMMPASNYASHVLVRSRSEAECSSGSSGSSSGGTSSGRGGGTPAASPTPAPTPPPASCVTANGCAVTTSNCPGSMVTVRMPCNGRTMTLTMPSTYGPWDLSGYCAGNCGTPTLS